MSDFVFHREYRGKVKGLVLDWSGTTADAYVIAPAVVFVEVFKNQDVSISMKEARGPMGLRKDLHIKALTETPEIRMRWHDVHGKDPDQRDVDRMFEDFVPAQLEILAKYADLLPGVAEVVERLQKHWQCGRRRQCGLSRCARISGVHERARKRYVENRRTQNSDGIPIGDS